ncbi:hypothetical protein D3C84_672890 [compost metagenome]
MAEHIAGHQPGTGDEDLVFAAVELDPEAEGVEAVEADQASLLSQVLGSGTFQHVAQRAIQQGPGEERCPATQVEPEVLCVGLAGDAVGGAGEALQLLVGVAQLGVDILGLGEQLIVQHEGAPQAIDVEGAAVEEVEILARPVLDQGGADAQVARHGSQGEVGDGAQHQVAAKAVAVQAEIPPYAAGGAQAVPLDGDGAGLVAVGEHELGIVAAVPQGALEIDGKALAHGGAATELGDGQRRLLVGAAADVQVAGGDVRYHGEAHQRDHRVGPLLNEGLIIGVSGLVAE